MKLTQFLFKIYPKEKYTTVEREIIFKAELPMHLRNHVSRKSLKSMKKTCLQEMYSMMACLKTAEFNEAECPKEIREFRNCCQTVGQPDISKDVEVRTEFNTDQMNEYLKKYWQDFRFI